MASNPPAPVLPVLYEGLEPLSSSQHGKMRLRSPRPFPQFAKVHAVPLTVDEFAFAQRFFPIIFSVGDIPVPLALMGLNEGVNTFFSDDGQPVADNVYMPAYIRRYPFMLARLRPDSDDLSLCVDPTADVIAEDGDGAPLFNDDATPSDATKDLLSFCEQFETAAQRTAMFVEELGKAGLLMDGEVAIQTGVSGQPFVYRGFRMVDEEKFRDLRGDELRKFSQNGMLPLIYAHLFSLAQIRDVFARQVTQGKGPIAADGTTVPEPVGADA